MLLLVSVYSLQFYHLCLLLLQLTILFLLIFSIHVCLFISLLVSLHFVTSVYLFYLLVSTSILLKILQSQKLSGDDHMYQGRPYLNSLIKIKLPFPRQEHFQIFPTSFTKENMCASIRFGVSDGPEKLFLLLA